MAAGVILSIPVTLVVAVIWLHVLKRFIPFYKDKRLPAGLPTFFLWGLVSTPLLLVLYRVWPPLWMYPDNLIAHAWNHIVMVGIIEELSKWLIFALVMHHTKPLRSPEDGVLFAAATALAFATVENVQYGARYGLQVLLIRSVLTTTGHMSYAALWGFVWSSVTWEGAGEINRKALPYAIAAVIPIGVVHGLYNASLVFGLAAGITIDLVTLVFVIIGYRYLLRHSPYRLFPFRESENAVEELTGALRNNRRSTILRGRRGMHYLRLQEYARAEDDFERVLKQSGSRAAASAFLRDVAAYAGDRTRVEPEKLQAGFQALPEGPRRAVFRSLPQALRSNRELEREILAIIAGNRERPEAYRSRREKSVAYGAKRRARRNLSAMGEAERIRRHAREEQYRREALSEEDRARLLAALRDSSR